jgi:hypothetical protein
MSHHEKEKAPTVGADKKSQAKKTWTRLEIQAKKKADEELKLKEAQAVLPGGKAVKRSKVIKLEFVPDTHGKLAQVAETIYNLDPPPAVASWNNLNWAVTDKMLYEQAKQEYDNVTQPFLKSPRVYRYSLTHLTIYLLTHLTIYSLIGLNRLKKGYGMIYGKIKSQLRRREKNLKHMKPSKKRNALKSRRSALLKAIKS